MTNNLHAQKKIKNILFLILIGAIYLALNYTGLGKETKNTLFLASSPLQIFLWNQGQGINHFIDKLKGIDALEMEKSNLELENERLKAELADLLELRNENEDLRKALDIGLEKEFKITMADIISKDPLQDMIIINKGSDDGLSIGFPVITPEKTLIGKIEEVFPNFSRVILTSNKNNSLSARIDSEEEIIGVTKGEGNLKIIFDLIPHEKEIKKGSLVTTTSLGGVFPKGLLIGTIDSIDYSDVKPFQTAQINPDFDFKNLDSIFVITNFKK